MQTLFLADLHLGENTPHIMEYFQQFIRYCEENTDTIEAIYFLGDFFEWWIGDDFIDSDLSSTTLASIIKQLNWLSQQSIKTYFIHGNRDFLIAEQFQKVTGIQLLPDPHPICIEGKKILLSHGDIFCTDDKEYQNFRNMVHNPLWQQEVLSKSIPERVEFAMNLRNQSQANYKDRKKQSSPDQEYIEDVNQNAIEQALVKHECNILIHGHTHRPGHHHFKLSLDSNDTTIDAERYVLAAWYKGGSFLSMEDGNIEVIKL